MKWDNKKFIDFIQLQRGYDLTKEQFIEGPYPVVSSTSIMGYHNQYKVEGPGVVIVSLLGLFDRNLPKLHDRQFCS
jgi:type I restriction enzyme S subunit